MSKSRVVMIVSIEEFTDVDKSQPRKAKVHITFSDRSNQTRLMSVKEIEDERLDALLTGGPSAKNLVNEKSRLEKLHSPEQPKFQSPVIEDLNQELSESKPVRIQIHYSELDKKTAEHVVNVTISFSDGTQDTRFMTALDIETKFTPLLTGEQVARVNELKELNRKQPELNAMELMSQYSKEREQEEQEEQEAIKISFGDFDIESDLLPKANVTITYQNGTTNEQLMRAGEIKDQFLFILTLKQANQLSIELDRRAVRTLRQKIQALDMECLGIQLAEHKSISFFSSQITMKEYLEKMAVNDPGKALKIVDIFEKAQNGGNVEAGINALQSELGKHRGFIRQFLQSLFGGSWGNTTGVTLLNELRKPRSPC